VVTFRQVSRLNYRLKRLKKKKLKPLNQCPQKKATCIKVFTLAPKKPCSARRAVTRVSLNSTKKQITCHIPGETHNLKRFSTILVRGGRPADLPAVRYRAIHNSIPTYDLIPLVKRKRARSKYGVRYPHRLHKVRATRGKGVEIYYRG
jgi:small subunit ribosomal protein S12